MVRLLLGIGAFFVAADVFDSKSHPKPWGGPEYAEVAILAILIISVVLVTTLQKDDD